VHNLGQTRSSHQPNHLLLTPDTFVPTTLPGMKNASAIVHIGPAIGAKFTEYSVEFEPQGELGPAAAQRFFYVLEGAILLEADGKRHELCPRGYAYLGREVPSAR
jgi:(S)-ureidoglycine aminohydrolase